MTRILSSLQLCTFTKKKSHLIQKKFIDSPKKSRAPLNETVQGKERGDMEIVVLQKPQDGTDRLPPPRTLILDFTMTHQRFGRSLMSSLGQLTHSRRSDGVPEPDGALREEARRKIRHYRRLYIDRPDPIAFMSVAVDTSRPRL